MEINELIKNRKEFVDAQIKNGFDLTTVLVGLYSDASHFVYEILQNAEDAKATDITFDLSSEKLVITHNGIPFNSSDIEAITGISNIQNNKKKDLEKIGKFGIGFKSVYAVTDRPRIQSGQYDFEITNFVLPAQFTDSGSYTDTVITLPFNHPKLSKDESFSLIKSKFETFEAFNLLFLDCLKSISLIWDGNTRHFSRKVKQLKNSTFAFHSTISSDKDKHEYLLFKKQVENTAFSKLKNKPNIAIAFKKDSQDNQGEITKADSSNLFAFFETGYETFLNFLIQAPFSTTPARDNIDFKLKVNLNLLDELCKLMKDILEHFRLNRLVSINFLSQLPIGRLNDESKLVYLKFFETVKQELSSDKKYLPSMFKNQYQAAGDLAIVRGKELTSIVSKVEDLQLLFGKKYWMDTKITVDRTPELFQYFTKELAINEYSPDDFARKITPEFLIAKPDTWIQKFYEFLNGKQESLWRNGKGKDEGVLRRKPIIRLLNGEHSAPFDFNGRPKVFLPLKHSQFKYDSISPKVILTKGALEFIKDKLGIKEPNIFDEIKYHIIPLYSDVESYPNKSDHIKHLKLVLEFCSGATASGKQDLIDLFTHTNVKFIWAFDSKTKEELYCNYQYAYLPNPLLEQYFRFSDKICFLNLDYYKSLSIDQFLTFLKSCGVKDYAWRLDCNPDFTEERLDKLRREGNNGDSRKVYWEDEGITDHNLEGLDDILENENFNRADSIIIWNVILDCLRNDPNRAQFFRGQYDWHYMIPRVAYFKNSILTKLQNKAWLFSKNEDLPAQTPGEILLADLSIEYDVSSDVARFFIDQLNFRSDAEQILIGQMPAERRDMFSQFEAAQRICLDKGVDLLTAINELMIAANIAEEEKEIENAPDIDDIVAEEEEFEGFDSSGASLGVSGSDSEGNKGEKKGKDLSNSKGNQMSQSMKDIIGKRGEKIVFNFLKGKWSKKANLISQSEGEMTFQDNEGKTLTIVLLNTGDKKGIGCDIVVKNQDTILEYIEVKSTKLEDKDLFSINGFQWSFAYNVFNQGEGNKYFFYVVKDVLGEKPRVSIIKNPIKKWKDGNLKAHPVNLEL